MAVDPAQPDRPSIHHRDGATHYVCSTWEKPSTAPWSHDYGYCRHSLDQLAGVNDPRCPADCPHKAPATVVAEFTQIWQSRGVAAAARHTKHAHKQGRRK